MKATIMRNFHCVRGATAATSRSPACPRSCTTYVHLCLIYLVCIHFHSCTNPSRCAPYLPLTTHPSHVSCITYYPPSCPCSIHTPIIINHIPTRTASHQHTSLSAHYHHLCPICGHATCPEALFILHLTLHCCNLVTQAKIINV